MQKTTPCELITDENIKNYYNCKVIGKDLKYTAGLWDNRKNNKRK